MTGSEDDSPLSEWDRERYARRDYLYEVHFRCRSARTCQKATCSECRLCPVCGGALSTETTEEVIAANSMRVSVFYACVNCGSRIDRQQSTVTHIKSVTSNELKGIPPLCSVRGCRHRVWSGGSVAIGQKNYPVCDLHRRAHQRWVRMGSDDNRAHLVDRDAALEMTIRRKP